MNRKVRNTSQPTMSPDMEKQIERIRPLRMLAAVLLWLCAAAFGIWFGSTAFRSRAPRNNLAGDAEVDRARPGPTRETRQLVYPDPDSSILVPSDPFDPAPAIQADRPHGQRVKPPTPASFLVSRQRLMVDIDMHRFLSNPCFSGLESLLHDRIVQPVLTGFGLQIGTVERVTASLSYSPDLDWYSNPILRFFVHLRRYLHAPLCLVAQVRDAQIDILKRLYRLGPLTAASILGRRVFYSPTGLTFTMPSQGYVVMCKGGDITGILRRWHLPRSGFRPLSDHLLVNARLKDGTEKTETRASLQLLDDGTSIEVRVSLTGKRHRIWRSRLRRALRSMAQSAWARRAGLSWQVDAARWRISPDDSTVRWKLERTCNRLRGYLKDVFH